MSDISYNQKIASKTSQTEFGPIAGLRNIFKQYQSYRANQHAIAELRGLNDLALKDIGICRSEITSKVWQAQAQNSKNKH